MSVPVIFGISLTILTTAAVSKFEKFEKNFSLSEYTCPADHVIFRTKNSERTVDCTIRCHMHPDCHGVFHLPETRTCVGCTNKTGDGFVASSLNSVYFQRSDMTGLTCSAEKCNKYKLIKVLMTWTDAKDHCTSLGGALVQIKSQEVQDQLIKFVLTQDNQRTWIGGSDLDLEGTFVWLDGSLFSAGYENWYPGKPDNEYGIERCMQMFTYFLNYEWNDAPCSYTYWSVCEFN